MSDNDWLVDRFEAHRAHLRAVAHRMLGTEGEADDAVQEAWLRLSRSDTSTIENLGGWLTTVVARVSLDMLRSRASRREEHAPTHAADDIVSTAETTREPRSPQGAGNRTNSRRRSRPPATSRRRLLDASRKGDFDALVSLLDPDVVLEADSTAVQMGSPEEIHGAAAVAGSFSGRALAAQAALIDGAVGVV